MQNVTNEVPAAESQGRRWGLKAAVATTVVVTASLSWMAVNKNSGQDAVSAELLASAKLGAPAEFQTTGSSDVEMYTLTIRPGATGGWHSHLGPVVLTVTQGTATVYEADGSSCVRKTIKAGQAAVEQPGVVHTTRNDTKRDLIIRGVAMHPTGSDMAVPTPRPADCHH